MSEEKNARPACRYVALDLHKHYCVNAAVDREGQVVLQPVRVAEKEPAWERSCSDRINDECLACV